MADEEQLRTLRSGVEAWHEWRKTNHEANIDLSGADLKGAQLERCNLEGANLSRANLSNANLESSLLIGALISGADLISANARGALFTDANLNKARLTNAILAGASLSNSKLREATLAGANLEGADLGNANLNEANLVQAYLEGANLNLASLNGTNLSYAILREADLSDAKLEVASLNRAQLNGADLRGAKLSGSDLTLASLTGAKVDATTHFNDPSAIEKTQVFACKIDTYALDSLDRFGGLSPGQLAVMDIRNDLADLRASYSGLQLWIHLIALGAFLFPYAWFLTARYSEAGFVKIAGAEAITLWEALGRFIWNGGQNWRDGWDFNWSFLAFVFLSIYNVGRGVLLWKTNQLEHREQITKIAARFSLAVEHFWRRLIKTMSVLFWISLGVLAYNTFHFMSQKVPTKLQVQGHISVHES